MVERRRGQTVSRCEFAASYSGKCCLVRLVVTRMWLTPAEKTCYADDAGLCGDDGVFEARASVPRRGR